VTSDYAMMLVLSQTSDAWLFNDGGPVSYYSAPNIEELGK